MLWLAVWSHKIMQRCWNLIAVLCLDNLSWHHLRQGIQVRSWPNS